MISGGLGCASSFSANELDFSSLSTFQPEIHVTQDTSLKNPLCKNNFSIGPIGSSGCFSAGETNESEEDPIKLAHSFLVDPDEFNINDIFMISPVLQLDYSSQLRSRGVYLENMSDTEIEVSGDNKKEVSGYSSSIGDSCIQDTSDADTELSRTLLWQFAQLLGTSNLQDEDASSEELQQIQTMNPAFKGNPPSSDHCQHVDRQGDFDRDKISAIEAVTRHPFYCY